MIVWLRVLEKNDVSDLRSMIDVHELYVYRPRPSVHSWCRTRLAERHFLEIVGTPDLILPKVNKACLQLSGTMLLVIVETLGVGPAS